MIGSALNTFVIFLGTLRRYLIYFFRKIRNLNVNINILKMSSKTRALTRLVNNRKGCGINSLRFQTQPGIQFIFPGSTSRRWRPRNIDWFAYHVGERVVTNEVKHVEHLVLGPLLGGTAHFPRPIANHLREVSDLRSEKRERKKIY